MNATGWSADDVRWMRRALRLASLCLGTTWPNPGVGCVLVRHGAMIGEGRTAPRPALDDRKHGDQEHGDRKHGDQVHLDQAHVDQEHGEAAALRDAFARVGSAAGATAYITLAPCTRRSAPGARPCTAALAAAGVERVVAAIADPHQDDAAPRLPGMRYEIGCCADVAARIHGGFLSRIRHGRPRVTGKWAMTLDGCLAATAGDAGWISSPEALALSRRRRRAFDAIVVGAGTARRDDPLLLSTRARRHGSADGPVRIVLGGGPIAGRLAATRDRAPVLRVAWDGDIVADPRDPSSVARALGAAGFNDVLIEGGATVHGAWLRAGLYDRLEIYAGAIALGGGMPVATGPGALAIADGTRWVMDGAPRVLGQTVLTRWSRS